MEIPGMIFGLVEGKKYLSLALANHLSKLETKIMAREKMIKEMREHVKNFNNLFLNYLANNYERFLSPLWLSNAQSAGFERISTAWKSGRIIANISHPHPFNGFQIIDSEYQFADEHGSAYLDRCLFRWDALADAPVDCDIHTYNPSIKAEQFDEADEEQGENQKDQLIHFKFSQKKIKTIWDFMHFMDLRNERGIEIFEDGKAINFHDSPENKPERYSYLGTLAQKIQTPQSHYVYATNNRTRKNALKPVFWGGWKTP